MNLYQTSPSCYRLSSISADPVVVCFWAVAAVGRLFARIWFPVFLRSVRVLKFLYLPLYFLPNIKIIKKYLDVRFSRIVCIEFIN